MTMTATQIREAIKPMMQFAPAIMSAIEIVESAEAAEKKFAADTKSDEARKKALADEIAVLETTKAKLMRETDAARKEAALTSEDTARRKAALGAEFAAARAEHDRRMENLGELGAQYAREIDKIAAEKLAKQSELDTVKKAFETFKTAHKL
jgi:hypothetical protein